MNRCRWFFLTTLVFLIVSGVAAKAGYKQTPWGSNTWTGPGRPPHWSAAPVRLIDPGRTVRSPRKPGSHWNGMYQRRCAPSYHCSTPVFSRIPGPETIVIDSGKSAEAAAPATRTRSKLQCAGPTISRTDPQTGEMIIEYVGSSRDCP